MRTHWFSGEGWSEKNVSGEGNRLKFSSGLGACVFALEAHEIKI